MPFASYDDALGSPLFVLPSFQPFDQGRVHALDGFVAALHPRPRRCGLFDEKAMVRTRTNPTEKLFTGRRWHRC